jgi:hypothetical protein
MAIHPEKGHNTMKRKLVALLLGGLVALGTVGSAFADGNNPSNRGGATTGYEGHPGNQAARHP